VEGSRVTVKLCAGVKVECGKVEASLAWIVLRRSKELRDDTFSLAREER